MSEARAIVPPSPRRVSRPIAAGCLSLCLLVPPCWLAGQVRPAGDLSGRRANLDTGDVPALVDALRLLQATSGVPIGFSPELVPDRRPPRCACRDVSVGQALQRLLAGTELAFVERGGQILVVPAPRQSETLPSPGSIVGSVRDQGPGRPIRSARIVIPSLATGAVTDSLGSFRLLELPPGVYRVEVAAFGFRSAGPVLAEVLAGATTRLDIDLSPDPLALSEIVVAPGTFGMLDDLAVFPQTLTREDMEALPQLGEDVFRAMERMPGVATDDISARMSVRGSHDDEVLIMLDGHELVEPYHLRDLDAALGVVDVATLGGVSLLAGGLPAEHGDRMSGLLDMRTRQPLAGDTQHSLGLSASNVTLRTQGSFADGRGGWLVSGRRGFLDLLLAMAAATQDDTNDDLSPRYLDVMARVDFLAASSHRLSAHFLYAGDDLTLVDAASPTQRDSLRSDWRNVNVWSEWAWRLASGVDVSTIVSGTGLGRARTGSYTSPGSSEAADFARVDDRGEFAFGSLRQDWRVGLASDVVLRVGGQLRLARADYRYENTTGTEFARQDGTLGLAHDTIDVRLERSATESSAYIAARVRPVDAMTVEAGARYDHRSHTSDSDLSPRLMAAFDAGANTSVRGSWGLHRQSQGVEELSVVDGDTLFFPSESARQVAVGVEHRLEGGARIRVEAYDRRVSDPRPRYLNVGREIIPFPEVGNDRVRFLPERARARGVEVVLAVPIGQRAEWTATYALAEAEDRLAGAWVPRTLDQRHTINLRWQFRPSDAWQLSAAWQYHTGWPSTPMEFRVDTLQTATPEGRTILINERPGALNSRRLPAYHRMDVRVTRSFAIRDSRLQVFLDIFNLYDRQNLRSYDYGVRLPGGGVIARPGETLLPILPSFGFTWHF